MSGQVVRSAAGILTRRRAQFGDKTLSSTQVYDWGNSSKRRPYRVCKHAKSTPSEGKLWPAIFETLRAAY
jgi:hypothetical protein